MAPAPFQVYPGQVFIGKEVLGAPVVTARKLTTAGGIAAGGNVPAITLTSNAGSSATVTSQVGYDQAGSFVLTAGTTATVGGTIATVVFGDALSAAPVAVLMSAANTTAAATTNLDIGALAITSKGFSIYAAGSALTSATYLVSYNVWRSPF
jgi:hypothetical protein